MFCATLLMATRLLGPPATGWVSWLKHRTEAEGTGCTQARPGGAKSLGQSCASATPAPPASNLHWEEDWTVACWVLQGRSLTTAGFQTSPLNFRRWDLDFQLHFLTLFMGDSRVVVQRINEVIYLMKPSKNSWRCYCWVMAKGSSAKGPAPHTYLVSLLI